MQKVTFSELLCSVATMRAAQKAYFKSRAKEDLYQSWNMERQVDTMIQTVFDQLNQGSLGSEEEKTPSAAAMNSPTAEPAQTENQENKPPF